ncbi:hypothetical protein BZA70DRAFT_99935 [Myxozyma melibiosi]|uniref:Secreted protein n=1 Tax=Myxozyma melibiosi TaxID=54550 RepID=A0ABR1EYH2_9ASCO
MGFSLIVAYTVYMVVLFTVSWCTAQLLVLNTERMTTVYFFFFLGFTIRYRSARVLLSCLLLNSNPVTAKTDLLEKDGQHRQERQNSKSTRGNGAAGARIGKNALRILLNTKSCPRVMWDSATISQWSPYPLRPDLNQRQPEGNPRIDGLSAWSHDPPVLSPRALWPQSPSSARRSVARTLVNSVATGPVQRHGLPARVFQRRDNLDVLNPLSNLAKEESHQIDRPGHQHP